MISAHPDGVLVEVWVVPGASRDEIVGEHDAALRVRVTAPPQGGEANRAVAALVAAAAGARRGTVVSGHGSRRKQVLIRGVSVTEARRGLMPH